MTTALLRALPAPPPNASILDFACGSGAIAAALCTCAPSSTVHLLDADTVALEAANTNVPSADATFSCAGWPLAGRMGVKYDWIVSNPPVHRGQPDDFVALIELIGGARRRLRKGGVLWLVAQEQVPVGRLLELHGGFGWVRAQTSEDGRFVTWSAGGKAIKDSGGLEAVAPIKAVKAKRKKHQDDAQPDTFAEGGGREADGSPKPKKQGKRHKA